MRHLCSCATWRCTANRIDPADSAGEPRLAELRFQLRRAAGKCRIDDIVERQRRGVGHHRGNVIDADLIAAAGVERELGDLVAGRLAVAAKQRDQHGARVRRELEPGVAHLGVDQPFAVALVVGVARQRRGVLRLFA